MCVCVCVYDVLWCMVFVLYAWHTPLTRGRRLMDATLLVGACGVGVPVCSDGEIICESTVSNVEERCNGEDDDCDGITDDQPLR